jgi:intracellular septation protein
MKFLVDFFPILAFFAAYKLYGIYVATAVFIAASLLQVLWQRLRHGQVPTMHLVTLAIALVFGGLTLVLQNPLFLKWKPTVVNALFAAGFLGSRLIGERTLLERMLGEAITLPSRVWRRLNTVWVIFFLATGLLNIYVAYNFSEEIWVDFKVFGLLGLTFAFVIAQSFYMARHIRDADDEAPEVNEET